MIDANRIDRVIDVLAGVKLELVGLTVTDGFVRISSGGGIQVAGELALTRSVVSHNRVENGNGGGIAGVGTSSVLRIDQSTILENRSTDMGGGMSLEGTLHMTNSTITTNLAENTGGGGLFAGQDAEGTVSNSTITLNSVVAGKGGGVLVTSVPFISIGHPVFENTIIAANTAPTDRDCSGAANSAGHNLLGVGDGCLDFGGHPGDLEGTAGSPLDPKLLPLTETGGPTPVHRPADGSPAVNHGADCEPVDQRGADRSPIACEIGAVEVTAQCITGGPVLCLNNDRFQVKVTWTTKTDTGSGQASQLTDESGFFTFFDPSNVELTVKVLNGCNLGGHYLGLHERPDQRRGQGDRHRHQGRPEQDLQQPAEPDLHAGPRHQGVPDLPVTDPSPSPGTGRGGTLICGILLWTWKPLPPRLPPRPRSLWTRGPSTRTGGSAISMPTSTPWTGCLRSRRRGSGTPTPPRPSRPAAGTAARSAWSTCTSRTTSAAAGSRSAWKQRTRGSSTAPASSTSSSGARPSSR